MPKRVRVKIAKWGGDDCYSWAVFKDGAIVESGCSRQEAAAVRDSIRRKIGEK